MRVSSWFQLCVIACGLTLMTNACSDAGGDDDADPDGGTGSSSSSSSGASTSGSSSGDPGTSSSGASGSTGSSSGASSSGEVEDAGADAADATIDTDAASDGGDASHDGGDASDDDGGGDAGDASVDPPAPPAVQFLGRWDLSTPGEAAASWPATRVVVRLNGTGLGVTIDQGNAPNGGRVRYDVLVDGAVQAAPLIVDVGVHTYPVVANLAAAVHTVELVRRTEPQQGITRFTAITPVGTLLAPPARPTRRIELLSESTVNGYGIEAPNPYDAPCNDAPDYVSRFHNARKSFAQKLADTLHAELLLTATSNYGVVRNEDGTSATLFKDVFTRVHPFAAGPLWNLASNQPDVVFVMLGGSDYTKGDNPPGFAAGYQAFANQLRASYPNAQLLYAVGPQIKNSYPAGWNMRTEIKAIMDSIVANDDPLKARVHVFPENNDQAVEQGCYGHANEPLHTSMATVALPWVRTATGWVD